MSSAEDVGMALAVRPSTQSVKQSALLQAQLKGMYQGLVSGLVIVLTALVCFLFLALWFGPDETGTVVARLVAHVPQSSTAWFWVGVMFVFTGYAFYKLLRWMVALPWREMWK